MRCLRKSEGGWKRLEKGEGEMGDRGWEMGDSEVGGGRSDVRSSPTTLPLDFRPLPSDFRPLPSDFQRLLFVFLFVLSACCSLTADSCAIHDVIDWLLVCASC